MSFDCTSGRRRSGFLACRRSRRHFRQTDSLMANWLVKSYWSAFVLWNLRREADLPFWPLESVLGIQNRRIRSIVKHAYEYGPFYRDAMLKGGLRPEDLRTAQDLERLPLVSKDQLVHEPERFRSRYYQDRNGLTLRSSGPTGLGVAI